MGSIIYAVLLLSAILLQSSQTIDTKFYKDLIQHHNKEIDGTVIITNVVDFLLEDLVIGSECLSLQIMEATDTSLLVEGKLIIISATISTERLTTLVHNCAAVFCILYLPHGLSFKVLPTMYIFKSQIYTFKSSSRFTDAMLIEEIFTPPTSNQSIRLPIGTWAGCLGFKLSNTAQMWDRRNNLGGAEVKIATIISPAEVIQKDFKSNTFYGPYIDVMNILGQKLNFKPLFLESVDGVYGMHDNNGTWNGMVGMLVRGQVDMIMADLSVSILRSTVIDFGPVMQQAAVGFLMVDPGSVQDIKVGAYIHIFNTDSWIGIGVMTLLVLMLIYIVKMFKHKDSGLSAEFTLSYGLKAMILQAGVPSYSDFASVRLSLVVCSLSFFLLFQFYAGLLTSFMTATDTKDKIKSFSQLFIEDYRLVALKSSMYSELLENSPKGSGLHNFFYSKMTKEDFTDSYENPGYLDERDPKTAFVSDQFSTLHRETHIFSDGIEDGITDYWAPAFAKNSQIGPLLSHHLKRMIETGSFDGILKKRNFRHHFDPLRKKMSEPFSLQFSHVSFLWMILISGSIISFIAAVSEMLLNYIFLKKRNLEI